MARDGAELVVGMMAKNGGAAFPQTVGALGYADLTQQTGMTLRQWYAGMALASGKTPAQAVILADELIEREAES